jgi:tRNA (guanine10-N2)-dimethyltransferase
MDLLSEFVGGFQDFSRGEIEGLLSIYGGVIKEETGSYIIFNSEKPYQIINRLTFSKRIGRVIYGLDSENSVKGKRFAVREKKAKGNESLIDYAARKMNGKVDLENPEITIYIYNMEIPLFTELLYERKMKDLLDSRYRKRPMNHPSSISPLIARGMINIAGIKEDNSFLDPFAGTGTLLIEGFRMGIKGYGIDKNIKMVKGGNENLKFFSFPPNIVQGDFSSMVNFKDISAIVTDPPYGRGSKIFSQSRMSLYERFFSLLAEMPIKKVFCLPDEELVNLAENFMKVNIVDRLRVHSSLTRYVIKSA